VQTVLAWSALAAREPRSVPSVTPTPSDEAARREARAEETAWVEAAAGGDRAAFGRLYTRYARVVHGVLLARVPHAHAEDLVQEVFVHALDRIHTLRDPWAFPGWISMIARNRATDFLRARRESDELPADLAAPESGEREALAVMAIVRQLPEAYRETLVLRLVEGLSGPEIAAMTGLTEGSVRVNLHRGVQLLRERLGREDHDV